MFYKFLKESLEKTRKLQKKYGVDRMLTIYFAFTYFMSLNLKP